MTLCTERPEGFGPTSSLHRHLPTTCFIDVIVVPIATWIYLLLIIVLFLPIYFRSRGAQGRLYKLSYEKRSLTDRILTFFYYLLIIAMVAMVSLEIARLSIARLGTGLLPFTYAGVLGAEALHLLATSKAARSLNVLYWIMLITAMAVKVAAEAKEGGSSRNEIYPVNRYKMVDEMTDVGVMIGVVMVLALLEFVGWHILG